jgi:mannose-1-phosphate guanylyltransferase
LLITKVQDPSKYGVVAHNEAGLVQDFVEKPTSLIWGNHINAGLYCLSPAILKRIPFNTPCSIEKEVFPFVAEEKKLFCLRLTGYWMDIGQPKDYIVGVNLHLASLRAHAPEMLATGPCTIKGNVLIDPRAKYVSPTATLGPDVVIGAGCTVEDGARLTHTTLLEGSCVKAHAYVDTAIIGWKSTVGCWGRVEASTVLGEDVQVGEGVLIHGALVLPHKSLRESVYEKGRIIM